MKYSYINNSRASNQSLKRQYEQHSNELCLCLNQWHNKGNLHQCSKKKIIIRCYTSTEIKGDLHAHHSVRKELR